VVEGVVEGGGEAGDAGGEGGFVGGCEIFEEVQAGEEAHPHLRSQSVNLIPVFMGPLSIL